MVIEMTEGLRALISDDMSNDEIYVQNTVEVGSRCFAKNVLVSKRMISLLRIKKGHVSYMWDTTVSTVCIYIYNGSKHNKHCLG